MFLVVWSLAFAAAVNEPHEPMQSHALRPATQAPPPCKLRAHCSFSPSTSPLPRPSSLDLPPQPAARVPRPALDTGDRLST